MTHRGRPPNSQRHSVHTLAATVQQTRLHFHSTRDTHDRFASGQVRHMNEGVVEGGIDVRDTEHDLQTKASADVKI